MLESPGLGKLGSQLKVTLTAGLVASLLNNSLVLESSCFLISEGVQEEHIILHIQTRPTQVVRGRAQPTPVYYT